MSKKIVIISLILSILALTGCSNNVSKNEDILDTVENEVTQHEDNIEPINEDIIETDPAESELDNDEDYKEAVEDIDLNTHEDNPLLELARQGKVDGIEFKINTSTDEVIEKWGLPDDYDYFMGGLYFSYEDENILFFTDAELNNEEIIPGNIKCIGVLEENKEIFNVRIGMTFEEIIAVLGEPTYMNTLEQNEGSELLAGSCTIVYDVGEYDIEFVSNTEKGSVDIVYLWGKN